ncbi:EAL domain-containing protein [Clostridioides difficile]
MIKMGHGTDNKWTSTKDKVTNYNKIDIEDIKEALANDEFKIYYQPLVDSEGKIIGVEALARWINSKYGNITPDIFMPILEKSNLIYKFQNKIFEMACLQIQCLNKITNSNIKAAINISPVQFENDNFISDIKRIINDNNIDTNYIEIEITESYPISRIKDIDTKLDQLKDMNIKVALDDFGTGYNSIKYLSEFDFDVVKIDKSFIDKVTENPDFISSIIEMIHSVGSKVVSEGVEEEEQVEVLKDLGSDIMQGYFFYRPLSFNELFLIITNDISTLLSNEFKGARLNTIV